MIERELLQVCVVICFKFAARVCFFVAEHVNDSASDKKKIFTHSKHFLSWIISAALT